MGLGPSRDVLPPGSSPWEHRHTNIQNAENNVDPDDGKSWLCSACKLPIFSTPFESRQTNTDGGGGKLFLHDQCANLPAKLMGHVFHPRHPLILKQNPPQEQTSTTNSCDKCNEKCGTMFYQCPETDCKFQLDVLCAVQVRILHRSHAHRLMVVRGSASFICGACGTQHQGPSALSYLCNACGFWIHPDCASLPNAIILHEKHQHSLCLTYDLPSGYGSDEIVGSSTQVYTCAICRGVVQSSGVYFCVKCSYYAHIKCVMSDPQSFKPVLIRDAKLAGLLHFPLADEFRSVMRYIIENTSGGSGDEADIRDEHHQSEGKFFREKLHEHPLILHDQNDIDDDDDDDDDGPGVSRVCEACVQFIWPPFYSCSQCPNFFLHSCCAKLPSKIEHPLHQKHNLFLFPKAPKSNIISEFHCKGCARQCNGFAYSCEDCGFTMDAVCALMPRSITHESHGKTHILYMSHKIRFGYYETCSCCNSFLYGVSYECRNCRHFKLHAKCALLPNIIRHKFDEHSLKLTTDVDQTVHSKEVQRFCEICEKDICKGQWYYSCNQCDHWFHTDCIPSLDRHSRIKLGVTVHVNCHDCPLTLIRESTVYGYRCGYCRKTFRDDLFFYRDQAFECTECYFRIHSSCVIKCLSQS